MSHTDDQSSFLKSDSAKAGLVGKDLLGYCSRCKMNLMHTIISVTGRIPSRARCNTCKTERTFRAPRKDIASKDLVSKESSEMSDGDVELDIDSGEKALLGEVIKKKPKAKAKAKAKTKKPKEAAGSAPSQIPLSMQDATTDDIAMFEAKKAAMRAQKSSQTVPYKASARFSTGEIIDHKSFGIGFVIGETGLNKIEVLFESGRKLLVTAPKSN